MKLINIKWADRNLVKYGKQVERLHKEFPKVLPRIVNQVGDRAKTQVIRTLTKQTGLPRRTIVKAIGDPTRAHGGNLAYRMETSGGMIRLKYFSPRETRKGVIAKPFGKSTTFPSYFLKAGWFPNRIDMPRWGGHVKGSSGFGKRTDGTKGARIFTPRSGVRIPSEMESGATKAAFEKTAGELLQPRVEAAIKKLLK